MKKLIEQIKVDYEAFVKDDDAQVVNGNKVAGTRARKASLEIKKAMKFSVRLASMLQSREFLLYKQHYNLPLYMGKLMYSISNRSTQLLLFIILLTSLHGYAYDVRLKNTWLEHCVVQDGERGMIIHTDLIANDMLNKKINLYVTFYDKNGKNNKGNLDGYRYSDGSTTTYIQNLSCLYSRNEWKNLKLFLPYSALKHHTGRNEFSYILQVHSGDITNIAYTPKAYFNVTFTEDGNVYSADTNYKEVYGSIHPKNDYRNIGSMPNLSGKVAVILYFVSSQGKIWNKADKDAMRLRTLEAETWLQEEAVKYNVKVTFENYCYGYEGTDIISDHLPKGPNSDGLYQLVPNLMAKQGYKGDNWHTKLMDWVKSKGLDRCFIIVFINDDGRSFSMPYTRSMKEGDNTTNYIEGCVTYNKYLNVNVSSSTIAHEILHLCGAWDLYSDKASKQSVENARRAKQYFPNSIMISTPNNINKVSIDELTAWLIGLSTNKKNWYESFEYRE